MVILRLKNRFTKLISTIDENVAKANRAQKYIDEEKQKALMLQARTGGFNRFM
jgi:hypothetical protein